MDISRFIPNSFQITNDFVEQIMGDLSGNALKCYLTIVRKTRGWQKEADYISISQFKDWCKIDERTIRRALSELCEMGLVGKHEVEGKPCVYFLTEPPAKNVPPTKNDPPQILQQPPTKNVPPPPTKNAGGPPTNFVPHKIQEIQTKTEIQNTRIGSGIAASPEAEILEAETPKSAKPKTADEKIRANPDNKNTWNAYASAYRRRYGILPESNAKVRGQVAQFVKLVGAEKAPLLAAYFPTHNGRWCVQCRHEFGLLLKSYQQIATDWATGQQMTETRARQAENTQSNLESHNGALEILKKHYGLE